MQYILTVLAADGEPNAIAALAATSRLLHTLVYGSPGSYLWREIYLTTFDDPRPARRITHGRVYTILLTTQHRTDDPHPQKNSPSTGAQSIDVESGLRTIFGHSH